MTIEVRAHAVADPEVAPLLAELTEEYAARYGAASAAEMNRYPATEFLPPGGVLLILSEDGESVAGGAFKRFDDRTAEIKRMWTHSAHRRRGLATRVLTELEAEAKRRGYVRLVLTTGPKQPEAAALYLATGYQGLDPKPFDKEDFGLLAFGKDL